jgi:catalase
VAGFTSFPEPLVGDQVRGKPERFADHYTQATLFWNSQTAVEKAHILRGFRFELSRTQVPAIRERVVAMLVNVADDLAASVAEGLGMPVPAALPQVIENPVAEIDASPALSQFARPGDGNIRTRKIAILVADGVVGADLKVLHDGLAAQGAVPRFVSARLGSVVDIDGNRIEVDATMEAVPAVLYDALVVPSGREAVKTLGNLGQAAEFVKEQYRHCKPILVLGAGQDLVENAGVPLTLSNGDPDPGLLQFPDDQVESALEQFITAIAKHRHFARQMDPPPI